MTALLVIASLVGGVVFGLLSAVVAQPTRRVGVVLLSVAVVVATTGAAAWRLSRTR